MKRYLNEPFDFDRHIVPLNKSVRSQMDWSSAMRASLEALVISHPAWEALPWSDPALGFRVILCEEHRRDELVPELNFQLDLHIWYDNKRHPRFSIKKALRDMGFRYYERSWPLTNTEEFKSVVQTCESESDFKARLAHLVPVWLYNRRLRFRVTAQFKEKFQKKSFTVDDFFKEGNHELRRLMLRRGVSIRDVVSRLKLLEKDSEGAIYQDDSHRRYLCVICPSTGQEYLLGIPGPVPTWIDGKYVEPPGMTPAEARRWTFSLPPEAEFAAEA